MYIHAFIFRARKWRASTYVYVRRYVRIYGRMDRETDGRTDGQQICNALTPVLNEMRCGGRETASGWPAGGQRVNPSERGCGGDRGGEEGEANHRAVPAVMGCAEGGRPSGRIPTLPILLLTISSKLLFAYKIIPHTS